MYIRVTIEDLGLIEEIDLVGYDIYDSIYNRINIFRRYIDIIRVSKIIIFILFFLLLFLFLSF